MDKLQIAFDLFDRYNQQDPNFVISNGQTYPAEYFYALQLYNWVIRLENKPSEKLLLASRSQHIGRWEIPRSDYPMNKPGYLTWRSDLGKYHAEKAGELMLEAGYDEEFVGDVKRIILKQKIKLNAEVQTMENALCLVFLEFQFEDFHQKHSEEKLIHILQKTWKKMSEAGHKAALTLNYSDASKAIIAKALA
ncbi:DUF4202 domain-containing protein [Mucilaginibacter sp. HMF5004]|uniref:DUF4202 domain-containing protein n=1 Tax=Mucilaginibacter rivuli TaxID=2857527 RepID=UPI001C5FAFEB|nr:DUF4202 domain-containing protein [Mucilaginibacter rivuli]MBW4889055.1 DUF4202 domain-containing protein [Mucilaginibacter rivuli]